MYKLYVCKYSVNDHNYICNSRFEDGGVESIRFIKHFNKLIQGQGITTIV